MPIFYEDSTVRMEGNCAVEEAPALMEWLETAAEPRADLKTSTHIHTAIVQALTEAKVRLTAAPDDPFLARWVSPLLATAAPAL